jgi:hypothetical protein
LRLHFILLALPLVAALSPCTAAQDAGPAREPALAAAADPMASFARMVPGEWRVTSESGTSLFDRWHWGPGQHSMRVMTTGLDAAGNPWRELQVLYWHPGRGQVCMLGANPFARSVMEGTIRFDGETADAAFDLYQTGRRREMGLRWTFDGPDRYRETLLEATGPAGLEPLAEWDHVRSDAFTAPRPRAVEVTPGPSERLAVLESLLDQTWETERDGVAGDALLLRSSVEWVPYADVIYARVVAPSADGEPAHLLDAYVYHHTGNDALQCLALSRSGGVYAGELTVREDGALQLDLRAHEHSRVVPHVVLLDLEQDGSLRARVWSVEGSERRRMLDVLQARIAPK